MRLSGKTIVFVANTSWYLYNFKSELIERLIGLGAEVVTVTSGDMYVSKLKKLGCKCLKMKFFSRGRNPFQDLTILFNLFVKFGRLRPSCVVQFTTKPNIYGSLVARLLGLPSINNVSGLGAAFDEKYGVRTIVRLLYKLSFRYPQHVFFLNGEDLSLFIDKHLVDASRSSLIPGAGVDVEKFRPMSRTKDKRRLAFLMLSRLIWEKGISDFIRAAEVLSQRFADVKFQLLGFPVENIRDGLTSGYIESHLKNSSLEYLGATDKVAEYIRNADCIVLPTRYKEGVPRSLLEAASMAKPIIASDNVGCREIVDHGENGLLFKYGLDSLVEVLEQFINLPAKAKIEMGKKGREKVLREFNIERVIDTYVDTIELLSR